MYTIKNDLLKIQIKKIGAELCEIVSVKNHTQFMWDADPDIWANFAPNLFPIIGMLKEGSYFYKGKKYNLSKHGFVRNNPNFQLVEEHHDTISLKLSSNEELLKIYPFQFEYYVIFKLEKNKLHVTYKVVNADSKEMYFSVGGHPAFKCPVFKNEKYSDYELLFDHDETSKTHLLNLQNGLVTAKTKTVFDSPTHIQLRNDIFDADALVFTDLKSRKVTLKSKLNGAILTLHFADFDYLGLWAKPNAHYVCIEPWLGIADSENSNQQLTEKEGIIKLAPSAIFEATFTIEIHRPHLD